ncbi:MAG TPA: phosphoglycolate phosphatase [Casimicrobiaceae bacterium]|nr:phosphoglycolate phosphatase [Casimicrobiaceae bacterium]
MTHSVAPPLRLNVRAVLFDLDGTLADTAGDLAAALNRVRADRSLPPMPLDVLRPHASHGARGMLGAAFGIGRESPEFENLSGMFLDYYAAALCEKTQLFGDAEEVLTEIERRGLRWGIVTNKATRFTLPILERLALSTRTVAVICGDTTANAKPHPEPLLAAALMLNIDPSDCVYVGDAERDIVAGRAAGMKTLIASYGYLGVHDTPEHWAADGVIHSLPELLDWLPETVALTAATE